MTLEQASGADALELNLSCPHGMGERGMGLACGQVRPTHLTLHFIHTETQAKEAYIVWLRTNLSVSVCAERLLCYLCIHYTFKLFKSSCPMYSMYSIIKSGEHPYIFLSVLVNIIPALANCFPLLEYYHISLNIKNEYFLLMEMGNICKSSRIM